MTVYNALPRAKSSMRNPPFWQKSPEMGLKPADGRSGLWILPTKYWTNTQSYRWHMYPSTLPEVHVVSENLGPIPLEPLKHKKKSPLSMEVLPWMKTRLPIAFHMMPVAPDYFLNIWGSTGWPLALLTQGRICMLCGAMRLNSSMKLGPNLSYLATAKPYGVYWGKPQHKALVCTNQSSFQGAWP